MYESQKSCAAHGVECSCVVCTVRVRFCIWRRRRRSIAITKARPAQAVLLI